MRTDRVLTHVDLDARHAVGELKKPGLAEATDRQNPSCGANCDPRALEFLGGLGAVFGDDRANRHAVFESPRIGIDTELFELLEIGAALNNLIGLVCAHSRDSVRRIASRMPLMKRTESSALNDRASSSASLMITLPGVSGSCRNSKTASRRISRSSTFIRSIRQCSAASTISGSISATCSAVPVASDVANVRRSSVNGEPSGGWLQNVCSTSCMETRPTSH